MYFVRTPYIIKKLFPELIWELPDRENKIYLTFDDGPHPEITPWILEQLKKYDAKATFFCLGENAEKHPEIVGQMLSEGHLIGNHGYKHLNGWKTEDAEYLQDVKRSSDVIEKLVQNFEEISHLTRNDGVAFRPPYGKIKKSQLSTLKSLFSIVNWSLMPGDFDETISSERCYSNLEKNVKSGDIVCLHDNEKAWKHVEYCLPKFLEYCKGKNFSLDKLNL